MKLLKKPSPEKVFAAQLKEIGLRRWDYITNRDEKTLYFGCIAYLGNELAVVELTTYYGNDGFGYKSEVDELDLVTKDWYVHDKDEITPQNSDW